MEPKQKHVVGDPALTTGLIYGDFNNLGLFSFEVEDIVSLNTRGGSALNRWLPARGFKTINQNVGHISFVAPENFDGAETYMDHMDGQDVLDTCDYGEGAMFNICEYGHTMYRMTKSTKNSPLVYPDQFGMKQCNTQPRYRLRGENRGMQIANDVEWQVSMCASVYEDHYDWNVVYGDAAVTSGDGMIDGIDTIIQTGWVDSKKVGAGSCEWTDPMVVNGIPLDTPVKVIDMIRAVVRKLIDRMADRGYIPTGDDLVIVISPNQWRYIADAIAAGALADSMALTNIQMNTTPEVWQRERDRITKGGLGYGFFPVDGYLIPVIPETLLGRTTPDGTGTTGDIFILTKNFRGIRILENQFLNFNMLPNPVPGDQGWIAQNGAIRVGWIEKNKKCYYYFMEGFGRIMSSLQPLQARINGVTITTAMSNENESSHWASQDYYPYGDNQGGNGVPLLSGL